MWTQILPLIKRCAHPIFSTAHAHVSKLPSEKISDISHDSSQTNVPLIYVPRNWNTSNIKNRPNKLPNNATHNVICFIKYLIKF